MDNSFNRTKEVAESKEFDEGNTLDSSRRKPPDVSIQDGEASGKFIDHLGNREQYIVNDIADTDDERRDKVPRHDSRVQQLQRRQVLAGRQREKYEQENLRPKSQLGELAEIKNQYENKLLRREERDSRTHRKSERKSDHESATSNLQT